MQDSFHQWYVITEVPKGPLVLIPSEVPTTSVAGSEVKYDSITFLGEFFSGSSFRIFVGSWPGVSISKISHLLTFGFCTSPPQMIPTPSSPDFRTASSKKAFWGQDQLSPVDAPHPRCLRSESHRTRRTPATQWHHRDPVNLWTTPRFREGDETTKKSRNFMLVKPELNCSFVVI